MTLYSYEAVNARGVLLQGQLYATNDEMLRDTLAYSGWMLTKIRKVVRKVGEPMKHDKVRVMGYFVTHIREKPAPKEPEPDQNDYDI